MAAFQEGLSSVELVKVIQSPVIEVLIKSTTSNPSEPQNTPHCEHLLTISYLVISNKITKYYITPEQYIQVLLSSTHVSVFIECSPL
jgi:hypothetical protein